MNRVVLFFTLLALVSTIAHANPIIDIGVDLGLLGLGLKLNRQDGLKVGLDLLNGSKSAPNNAAPAAGANAAGNIDASAGGAGAGVNPAVPGNVNA